MNSAMERRAREAAAIRQLRYMLGRADPNSCWREEKADIIEGAVYIIQTLVVGVTEQTLNQAPATLKGDKSQVEKQRRARESQAIEQLKELLMIYSMNTHSKMSKLDVLMKATNFIKSTVESKSHSSESSASPISFPFVLTSPTGSEDSGHFSLSSTPLLSPELVLASTSFCQMSIPLPSKTPADDSTPRFNPSSTKNPPGIWRPWQ